MEERVEVEEVTTVTRLIEVSIVSRDGSTGEEDGRRTGDSREGDGRSVAPDRAEPGEVADD